MNPSLAGPGNLIKGRWKILRKIGQGAFGSCCASALSHAPTSLVIYRDNIRFASMLQTDSLTLSTTCLRTCIVLVLWRGFAWRVGEIYSGRNVVTSEHVAIKVERVDSKKQVLKLEVAVLKKLQGTARHCAIVRSRADQFDGRWALQLAPTS